MLFFLLAWSISAVASVLLFTVFSLTIDRRVFFSSWVQLALSLTALLGPLGTVFILYFLIDTAVTVCRIRRRGAADQGSSPDTSPSAPCRPAGVSGR